MTRQSDRPAGDRGGGGDDGRITNPGIYSLSAEAYHADPCVAPSLSASIITRICRDSAWHAWYAHPRLNPAAVAENGEAFDLGTTAHALLLEGTAAVELVDAADWRTSAAKTARDNAREAGRIPILKAKWSNVQAMIFAARALLAVHRDGGAEMFTAGEPERVAIWREGTVWCRARIDWLREGAIDDYKTTSASANPEVWTRTLFQHGYDIQAAWYARGVKAITGIDPVFRFAVQELAAPHALSVIGLGPAALVLAEKKIRYALEVWREGLASESWPGYPTRTCWADLPAWEEARWLERESPGAW